MYSVLDPVLTTVNAITLMHRNDSLPSVSREFLTQSQAMLLVKLLIFGQWKKIDRTIDDDSLTISTKDQIEDAAISTIQRKIPVTILLWVMDRAEINNAADIVQHQPCS